MDCKTVRRIVLLGETATGKSSSGNTILGEKVFNIKALATSKAAECKTADGTVHGRKITVIDTPGFFDTDHDDSEIKSEIITALTECAPGIDAFVIVLRVGRYTKQKTEVIEQLLNTLEEDVLKHAVILFTSGEQLEDQTLEEFMKDNKELQELLRKCGRRCHVIDNKYWADRQSGDKSNRVQVKNLLETIDKMVEKNGRYTSKLFVEEDTTEEIKKKNKRNLPFIKQGIVKTFFNIAIIFARGKTRTFYFALLGVGVAIASGLLLSLKYNK